MNMMKKTSKTAVLASLFFLLLFVSISLINLSFLPIWPIWSEAPHSSSNTSGYESRKHKTLALMKEEHPLPPSQPRQIVSCDRSHKNYDICKINGPTVLDPISSTFYVVDPMNPSHKITETIRPYPRKWEDFVMKRIKEIKVTSGPPSPSCQVQHNVPALVFSAGGYTGNFFHEFNDGFIPLFITVNTVFPDDQDFILVISKSRDWWVSKYEDLFRTCSKHPIINLDNDTSTHCFTSATLGLISHGLMTIDPKLMPSAKTFTHFHAFLGKAYDHAGNRSSKLSSRVPRRPRLVLMSRSSGVGRVILNQNEVLQITREVGFDTIVFEPTHATPLREAYALVNSSHAMVGVHGAALTHSLFLRPGSVMLQVVPIGNDWLADVCFGNSAREMGLEYMEYRIGVEESSLVDKYDKNSLLIQDSVAYRGKNWSSAVMDIYLEEQNVRLDLVRFRGYLKKAYDTAMKFMEREG